MSNASTTTIILVLLFGFVAGCAQEPAAQAPKAQAPAARAPAVPAREMTDAGRGELLYQTACAACHTEQAHWREKSIVHSWGDLVYQVSRWQKVAGQNWRAEDIEDVAAYLNRRFYRLPCPLPGCAAEGRT